MKAVPKESNEMPRVSVLIPTKNRAEPLGVTLRSLLTQEFTDFEVVIVDGYSSDDTFKVIDSFKDKLKIRTFQETGGLIPQMNVAYQKAVGEIVIRTDDDVIFTDSWIKAIVETMDSDENVGGVTGPTVIPEEFQTSRDLFFYENKLRNGNMFWRLVGRFYFDYILEGRGRDVSTILRSGAFTLGNNFEDATTQPIHDENNLEDSHRPERREFLARVGGFDPAYLGIGEGNEPDAAFKIIALGKKLMFNPEAKLFHCPSVEGFYKQRPSSFPRIINFITLYRRHIKVDNFDKFCRFSSYLIFQNLFYVYSAFTKRDVRLLGALPGTVVGLMRRV